MIKPIYSLIEDKYFPGLITIEVDGCFCAQFSNLNLALNYCRIILNSDPENYKEIEFTDINGNKEKIKLF